MSQYEIRIQVVGGILNHSMDSALHELCLRTLCRLIFHITIFSLTEKPMNQREQSLEVTIFIQGIVIGALYALLTKIEPDFKRKLLSQLEMLVNEQPDDKETIAKAQVLVEQILLKEHPVS
jgi:hypothetical protein